MEKWFGRLDWKAGLLAGVIAGAVFLILALALVPLLLGGSPWGLPRMIAAILMGEGVLTPETFSLGIVLVAVGVHFVLSIIYAFVFALVLGRMDTGPALLTGLVGGLVLYLLNFYGFTALFPWFAAARNWLVIVNHLVFGAVTAWSYTAMARAHAREEAGRAVSMKEKHA
jgi:hypothetical protein